MFKTYVGPEALTNYQGAMCRQPTSFVHRAAHRHQRLLQLPLRTLILTHNNLNMARHQVNRTLHLLILLRSLRDIPKILMRRPRNKIPIQVLAKVKHLYPLQMLISLHTHIVVILAMDMREEMPHPVIQELVMTMSQSTPLSQLAWATQLSQHLRMPV